MACRFVPASPCQRCGGLWWHSDLHGAIWHSCVHCGFEPAAVHMSPDLYAARAREGEEDARAEARVVLTGYDDRAIASLYETPLSFNGWDAKRTIRRVAAAWGDEVAQPRVRPASQGRGRVVLPHMRAGPVTVRLMSREQEAGFDGSGAHPLWRKQR